jgi:hypothetical protein
MLLYSATYLIRLILDALTISVPASRNPQYTLQYNMQNRDPDVAGEYFVPKPRWRIFQVKLNETDGRRDAMFVESLFPSRGLRLCDLPTTCFGSPDGWLG